MSILKIKRLHPQAQLPARATDGQCRTRPVRLHRTTDRNFAGTDG